MLIRRSLVVVALLALAAAGRAHATDSKGLRLLMLSAEDMNTPQTPLRADVTIEVEGRQGETSTQAIALFAPGKDARWYFQLREPALRALVLGSERKVIQRSGGGATETVPIGSPIDALGIAYEDLSRFKMSDFKTWQIVDEGADHVLVGMYPIVDSAYVYRAYSFDKEKTVPTKIQFYAKTLNNLVKLRLDSDHVRVGTKWLPTAIQIQNYADGMTTRLHVHWTPNAKFPAGLLAPASFSAAAPLPWPAAPAPSPGATSAR
jgi:hypothetical protein